MANDNVGKVGGDVFAVLGWGLRKYAWLVALFVLGLGVLVPVVLNQIPVEYEAQAQVGPTEELNLQNLDPIPRLAESVFNNGSVAEAVRESYSPPLARSESVIPDRVTLVVAQDNVVLIVAGRGPTPEAAATIANVAADTMTDELNKYSAPVGEFAVQRRATAPGDPVSTAGGPLSVVIGLVAGLVAAVGTIGLLLALRRPVLDVDSAHDVTGAPVLGRVWLGRSSEQARGLPQLCGRILASGTSELLLTGSPASAKERQLLTSALTSVLAETREVMAVSASSTGQDTRSSSKARRGLKPLVVVDSPSQARITARPKTSKTLLVVRVGTPRSSLRRQAEQYLDDGAVGVVLVDRPRAGLFSRSSRRSPEVSPDEDQVARPDREEQPSETVSLDTDAGTQPQGAPRR